MDPRVDVNKFMRYDAPIHTFIRKQLSQRVEMIVNLLTSGRGANINLPNEDGITPLHLAAEVGIHFSSNCVLIQCFGSGKLTWPASS